MKILALDIGKKRIGLATCDRLEIAASPYSVIRAGKNAGDQVGEVLEKEEIESVVIGLPVSFDGVEREMCQIVRFFKNELGKRINLTIEFFDERLTSKIAEASLIESGMRREQRREVIDAVAASLILQGYLDHRKNIGLGPV
jgi:putative Holliday junction resolvase